MTPTIGRMVYYKARGSADGVFPKVDRAAVVTDVRDSQNVMPIGQELPKQVRLCVMNPEGLFFTAWLDQGQEGGQWDWMPFQKDQVARMAPGTLNESHPTGSVVLCGMAMPTQPQQQADQNSLQDESKLKNLNK